jgi:hypothetical protein
VLLFVEDHLATIQDLNAVKVYDLASTVDPQLVIGIDAAWQPLFADSLTASRAVASPEALAGAHQARRIEGGSARSSFRDKDAFDIKAGWGKS